MTRESITRELKQHWWQVGLVGLGVMLIGIGIVAAQQQTQGETLEIIDSPSPQATAVVVIDVAGSVMQPGIYRLPQGSRLGEAIVAAGGLAARADRSYVARFINQAEMIRDGMKLYIPEEGESQTGSGDQVSTEGIKGTAVISINQASESELDTLWGVGPARAKMILENRPYTTLEELVSKAGMPQDVVDKNQGKIGL